MPEKMNNHIDTELNLASKHTDTAEKILIVDDEKLHQYSLMALMKQNDYDVDSVSSGEAAIEIIQLDNIGIILLDLNMDGINGEDDTQHHPKVRKSVENLFETV